MNALAARLADSLWNPIMMKELRAGTRGLRYFIVHLSILLIVAAVLLFALWIYSETHLRWGNNRDMSEIGSGTFLWLQGIQLAVVFLVVPAYSAASIVIERDQATYEILMSSTLSPWRITWGKLSASMTQVGLIFVSLIPLVAITFLFGGVSPRQVIANYAFLFVLSCMLSTWALSISASVKTTLRAVIGVYAGTVIFGVIFFSIAGVLGAERMLQHYLAGYGFIASADVFGRWGMKMDVWQELLYVYVTPLALAGLWCWFFILNAASRLKPYFADKAAPYRVFYLVSGVVLLVLAFAAFCTDIAAESAENRAIAVGGILLGLAAYASAATFFATEDPILPAYLKAKYAALPLHKRWLLFLGPGARAGDRFALIASGALVLLAFAFFFPFSHGMNEGDWVGGPPFLPLAMAAGSVFVWIYFLGGLGAFFGATLRNWPALSKVLLVIIALLLSLLPIVHWALTWEFTPYHERGAEGPNPASLAFSPVAAILSGILPRHTREWIPLYVNFGFPMPLHVVYLVLYGAAGALFRAFAYRRIRRLEGAA